MRPDHDTYFLAMAYLTSTRGTCARRKVGCVLVNARHHVIATGYNGPASGDAHCIDVPCPGVGFKSGQGLDACQAIHAEQNAVIQCRDVYDIHTCYCTDAPCIHCLKILKNTGCRRIVYAREYAAWDPKLWGRKFLHIPMSRQDAAAITLHA